MVSLGWQHLLTFGFCLVLPDGHPELPRELEAGKEGPEPYVIAFANLYLLVPTSAVFACREWYLLAMHQGTCETPRAFSSIYLCPHSLLLQPSKAAHIQG